MSQQSWQPANLSPNAEDNKALHRHIFVFFVISRTMTSQGRSENSDQSRPLHPMLPELIEGNGYEGRQTSEVLNNRPIQHRGKTYAHALTSALPVCTCGFRCPNINLVVTLTVCQLVVVNQQTQMKEKRTTITKKVCRR